MSEVQPVPTPSPSPGTQSVTQPARGEQGLANLTLERALLGALLVDLKDAMPLALDAKLKAEDFYQESHGNIYSAIMSLWDRNAKVDTFTVAEELNKRGFLAKAGGQAYLTQLFDNSGHPTHVKDYALTIVDKSQLRQLLKICGEVADACKKNDGQVQEIIDDAESKIFSLRESRDSGKMIFLPDVVQSVHSKVAAVYSYVQEKGGSTITGLPTGYSYLDHLTGGFQPSDLIVLGGQPGMGKTSLALNLALNLVLPEKRQSNKDIQPSSVLMFSMEMSHEQLINKLYCQVGGYDLKKIRTGGLSPEEMKSMYDTTSTLARCMIYIEDSPGLTPFDVRAVTRRLMRRLEKTTFPLKLVVVDYLQLMRSNSTSKYQNQEQVVREISGALKALAKELNIVVLALSQLNRGQKDPSKPSLADLRDSGAIAQDADIVAFIVRKEKAFPDNPEFLDGQSELIIRKHRNGPDGTVNLCFKKESSSFEPMSLQRH
ncbi:MAG: replicative DNA helicase [Deltaproteobacteria bacterium]|jgi:replicative DNA helicase|nr:replicative DNA helicase [Deltaproteobacteria bacterium]